MRGSLAGAEHERVAVDTPGVVYRVCTDRRLWL